MEAIAKAHPVLYPTWWIYAILGFAAVVFVGWLVITDRNRREQRVVRLAERELKKARRYSSGG